MAWREHITNNLGWKIFSILISTYIWFSVHNRLDVRKIETNPLLPNTNFDDKKVSYAIASRPIRILVPPGKEGQFRIKPTEVEVILQREVSEAASLELSSKDVHAFVDLTDLWKNNAPLPTNAIAREVLIQAPPFYTPVKVEPKTVVVEPVNTQ